MFLLLLKSSCVETNNAELWICKSIPSLPKSNEKQTVWILICFSPNYKNNSEFWRSEVYRKEKTVNRLCWQMKLVTKLASKNKHPGCYPWYNGFITCDALLIKKPPNKPSNTNWIWNKCLASLNFNCMKGNRRHADVFIQNQYRNHSSKRLYICPRFTPSFISGKSFHQGLAYHNK